MAKRPAKAKPRVAAAVGNACAGSNGISGKTIEEAMAKAAQKAMAAGETDPVKIRHAMLAARDEAKKAAQ